MVKFTTTILQFSKNGEKTGWTYIEIPSELGEQLNPANKKSFRVKGKLDDFSFNKIALLPMGDGNFIMALNAAIRKAIRKTKGAQIQVQLEFDNSEIKPPPELIDCINDEPKAAAFFKQLTKGHQNYFINWIESAKTEPTKTKRIAQAVNALAKNYDFGLMLRSLTNECKKLLH